MKGKSTDVVVIFTPSYQVAVWYEPESGELVHTNGGTWSRIGSRVTETVEFDSDRPERAGSSVSFDIELSEENLSIVGSEMQLTRIEGGGTALLEGAWEVVEVYENDAWSPADSEAKRVRLMSGSRFQFIEYNPETGKISNTRGGMYSLDRRDYVESVAFDTSKEGAPEQQVRFSVEREQDTWTQVNSGQIKFTWKRR